MMALPHDMIGLATTNALPTMAPWGGTDKIVGINPLAVAIPADKEDPIVIDAAFSASSHGKIRVFHQKGLAIPEGWALDAEGRPTSDAAAAIDGLLRPIGDYKGVGLAVVMGVLSAALSGACYGTDLGTMTDGPQPGRDGQFLMALNVAAFIDVAEFKYQVDRIVRQIRASRLAPGFDQVFSPGELEAVTERRYRIEGIPLNPNTVDDLIACATSLGVDAPLWSLDEAATPAES
jgi:LDH2 family malate/lactate/ureidoglycolate dehydrogenase